MAWKWEGNIFAKRERERVKIGWMTLLHVVFFVFR